MSGQNWHDLGELLVIGIPVVVIVVAAVVLAIVVFGDWSEPPAPPPLPGPPELAGEPDEDEPGG